MTSKQQEEWFRSADHAKSKHMRETCLDRYEHQHCLLERPSVTAGAAKNPDRQFRRNVRSLLRLCRLANLEATYILYKSNTFAFSNAFFLHDFLASRTSNQLRLIESLTLSLSIQADWVSDVFNTEEWRAFFSGGRLGRYLGLKRLHLFLKENSHVYRVRMIMPEVTAEQKRIYTEDVEDRFKELQAPLLECVTVVVACTNGTRKTWMSLQQRLEVAGIIRSAALNQRFSSNET